MKVRAKRMGYYNHLRRREGVIFEVDPKCFSDMWMEQIESEVVVNESSDETPRRVGRPRKEEIKEEV